MALGCFSQMQDLPLLTMRKLVLQVLCPGHVTMAPLCSHSLGFILFYLYTFLCATLLYRTLKEQKTEKPMVNMWVAYPKAAPSSWPHRPTLCTPQTQTSHYPLECCFEGRRAMLHVSACSWVLGLELELVCRRSSQQGPRV